MLIDKVAHMKNALNNLAAFGLELTGAPTEEVPANEINIYCDGGSRPNPGHSSFGIWGIDDLGTEYNAWGYVDSNSTNNRAELISYIRVLEMATYFGWKTVNVYFDSRYVMDGAKKFIKTWVKNGWRTKVDNIIANKAEWEIINTFQKQLKASGQKITYTWVKGHSGNKGNENADTNATKALLAGEKGDTVAHLVVQTKASIEAAAAELLATTTDSNADGSVVEKPVKVKKALPCNKLIAGKRIIFTTNTPMKTPDGLHVYMVNSFDDSGGKNGKYIAKPASDSLYGVVLTKEPVPQLETIIQYQNSITPNDFVQPVIGLLDRILRPVNWQMLTDYGMSHLTHNRLSICTVEKEPLSLYLRPPRLAYDAIETSMILLDRLDCYRLDAKSTSVEYMDITDALYTPVSGKGKGFTLHKGLSGQDKHIDVNVMHGDKSVNVALTVGIDLPPRNNLSAIGKTTSELTVTLVKFDIAKAGFRYSVIFKTDTDYAIYTTTLANLKIL